MSTKQTSNSEIHALTTAEIARQTAPLVARHREIVNKRGENYKSKPAPAPVFNDDEIAAREHARHLLNGSAPESLSLPPSVTEDRILLREQRGIELALKVLSSKDLVARASEAVAWAEENTAKWCELCHAIVLTVIKLDALECSARELIGQCVDIHSVRLPLGNVIGGRAISETPVNDLLERALAAGVITASEVKKAKS
jgi:hypothetical protein